MRKIKILLFVILTLGFSSCGDFLEEYSQDTSYVRNYEDLDELLLGSGYMPTGTPSSFANDNIEAPWYYPYIHLMGDEVDENITNTTTNSALWDVRQKYFGYYTWQQQVGVDYSQTSIRQEDKDWNMLYLHINIANMIIANIDSQDGKDSRDELEKQRIKGEAFFLRGAYYFTLANMYGKPYEAATAATDPAVPIKLTEFIEDKLFSRNTVQEVYEQAIADLLQAEELLDGTTRKSYYRASKTAAELLLSRLYLYMQDNDKAMEYANKVIHAGDNRLQDLNAMDGSTYFLNPDLSEVIFSMGNGGVRSSITNNIADFGVSDYLWELYDDSDLRKTYYVKWNDSESYAEYVKGGGVSDLGRTSLSANFLFRTSEAYLNLAEAAAYKGAASVAQDALNSLRKNRIRNSEYQDVTATGNDLIDVIRDERGRELCLEGHRWFDLRRYTVNSVYPFSKTIQHSYTTFEYSYSARKNVPVQTSFYELELNDAAYTLPIPREVISFNVGMSNNSRPPRSVINTISY